MTNDRMGSDISGYAADPNTPLSSLLPSAEELTRVTTGASLGADTGANSTGIVRSTSVEIPRALLNARDALPHPQALEDVRRRREKAK